MLRSICGSQERPGRGYTAGRRPLPPPPAAKILVGPELLLPVPFLLLFQLLKLRNTEMRQLPSDTEPRPQFCRILLPMHQEQGGREQRLGGDAFLAGQHQGGLLLFLLLADSQHLQRKCWCPLPPRSRSSGSSGMCLICRDMTTDKGFYLTRKGRAHPDTRHASLSCAARILSLWRCPLRTCRSGCA